MSAESLSRPLPPQPGGELRGLLTTMVTCGLGPGRRIRAVEHRPSTSPSSFAMVDVDVVVDDGALLRLVLKVLGAPGLGGAASMAKPLFLHDPMREIELYLHVLSERPQLGAPLLYSTVVEPERDRYWLLLERSPGRELARVEEGEAWRTAARWLAELHTELAPLAGYPSIPGIARLLRYDADLLRMWMVRAQSIVRAQEALLPAHLRMGMNRLAGRYERLVQRLIAMPETVIHGEFHPSNILVQSGPDGVRIRPVDWEMAGIGPHLLDLAALIATAGSGDRAREIALAYRDALPNDVRAARTEAEFLEDLGYRRLHLAVQWLGWSPETTTPTYRVEPWLGEVLRLADEVGL